MVRVRFRSEIRKVHMRDFKIAQRMLQIVQMYKLYTKAVLATSCIAFFCRLTVCHFDCVCFHIFCVVCLQGSTDSVA